MRQRILNGVIEHTHTNIEVKQVYCWICTKDCKLVIVSKDWIRWQLPWWKPKANENIYNALEREVFEETWIKITNENKPELFWYYHVIENKTAYLQVRFWLSLWTVSDQLVLSINEVKWESDQIKFIKTVPFSSLQNYIPWLSSSLEYDSMIDLVKLNE